MDYFEKVIGYDAEKEELIRYCDYFTNTAKYKELGVNLPKGILLYGEPGIGKTLMAESFIKACGVYNRVIKKECANDDFLNYIKESFSKAKNNAPSIILLDDMDKFSNSDDEHRNTEEYVVIQSCIDDCKDADVFVIATVNDRWALPDSLIRAGRFDKLINMQMPSGKDAVKIIKYYLASKKILDEVDAEEIGRILQGHSCAELETIINEAGIYAAFDWKKAIDKESMIKACLRSFFSVYSGLDSPRGIYVNNRAVAIHEVGHIIVSEYFYKGSVSFVAIGNIFGIEKGITITKYPEADTRYDKRRKEEIDIIISLAGRAATEIITGELDVGVIDDLQHAYNDAYGLIVSVGAAGLNIHNRLVDMSEVMKRDIECAVNVLINRMYDETKKIIIANKKALETMVDILIENDYLTYKDIKVITDSCLTW